MADETQTEGKDRSLVRLFVHDSDPTNPRPRADLDVTAVIFQYADNQHSRIELSSVFPEGMPPPCVGRAAAAFGINTSAGNAGNTLSKEDKTDPGKIREAVEARLEIFEAGKWSQERQGGGERPSDLLNALIAFRQRNGQPVDDASLQKFKDRFDDKDAVKAWKADPDFLAVLLEIQSARRLAAAQAAGKKSDLLA
jgi:hypothetical protein